MKDYEKEIEKIFLDDEEDTLRRIKITYDNALVDVQKHVDELTAQIDKILETYDVNDVVQQSQLRAKVYQRDYQNNLRTQINKYLDVIKEEDVKTIGDYLKRTYSNGFLTEQYRLMNEGIDIVMPINQKLLTKAVTYSTNNIPLSERIYDNVEKAKKEIVNEISRSISTGMSIDDTARNLQNTMGVSQRKAYQIAQNEGSRVRNDAVIDEMRESKKKGADIVKVWTAILDGKVRPHHRELDGKWAEVEGYFKYSGGEVFAPKQFGIASEDINCRCSLLSKPRWDLTEKHTQMDSVSKKLVEVKNYQDWYDNFYTKNVASQTKEAKVKERNYANNFASVLGTKYDEYIDILDNCQNENLKQLYSKHLDEFNIKEAHETDGAYYQRGSGIHFNIDSDSVQSSTRPKFSVLYHESGHQLDDILGGNRFLCYTEQYNNGGFQLTIKQEVNDWVDSVFSKIKDEFKANKSNVEWLKANNYLSERGEQMFKSIANLKSCSVEDILSGKVKVKDYPSASFFMPKVEKSRAYAKIESEIRALTDYEKQDLSDILEGATNSRISSGWGHGQSYWNDRPYGVGSEAFAEMTSATFSNADSLRTLKKYLPKSVAYYEEMIENALKGGL